MTALSPILRRLIAETGPIGVAAYMALCLGHPRHGYYTTRDPLGRRGDFITAPEISQAFGECLAVWCALAWERMGRPAPLQLVELGPGRGTLMADLLRASGAAAPEFAAALRPHLVESSPALRAKQQAALAGRAATWHDAIETLPRAPTIAIANEFFDALPIRQFLRVGGTWRERHVAWDESMQRFVFVAGPALSGTAPPALAGAKDGAVYEIAPAANALAEDIGYRLARDGGAALVVDYGRRETACGDSLAAIHRQAPADPLAAPGESDLTAHVDFAALATAFRRGGAEVAGPIEQRSLLRRLGIESRRDALMERADRSGAAAIRAGIERLIAPGEMGSVFLALAATAPGLAPPAFETID